MNSCAVPLAYAHAGLVLPMKPRAWPLPPRCGCTQCCNRPTSSSGGVAWRTSGTKPACDVRMANAMWQCPKGGLSCSVLTVSPVVEAVSASKEHDTRRLCDRISLRVAPPGPGRSSKLWRCWAAEVGTEPATWLPGPPVPDRLLREWLASSQGCSGCVRLWSTWSDSSWMAACLSLAPWLPDWSSHSNVTWCTAMTICMRACRLDTPCFRSDTTLAMAATNNRPPDGTSFTTCVSTPASLHVHALASCCCCS
mmetsp:Transcript_9264/g.24981  ORF Transcript_9264/g.24981 Transcript_9264/m.24981 type:complete len:252 (+) Transcript_9264:696-1451(+)